ncbi:MAG: DNA repair protein RecN, partial [Ignavibacteria bacterium]
MLEKLFIKNYLIIKEAELNFTKGLNILTGETGAGKTIILDALSLILGDRADYSIIKNEKEKLIIEGIFRIGANRKIKKFLKDKELILDGENSDSVILRRELYKKGFSRNFINDTPVSNSDLNEFGNLIIDIHSQNEHQSLLKKDTHLDILDSFITDKRVLDDFKKEYENYKELTVKYNELVSKKDSLLERKVFLEFQLKEINDVNPQTDEDTQLENELSKLENSEEISLALNTSLQKLYEGDGNILAGLSLTIKELKKISKYDSELEKLISEIESSYISLKDVSATLSEYNDSLNFDAVRIEQIRDRLGALNFLKKKYKLSVNELIKKANSLNEELNFAENYDYEIDQIKKKIESENNILFKLAIGLTEQRKKTIKDLQKSVNSYLKEVGLETAEFKVAHCYYENVEENLFTYKKDKKYIYITSTGIDDIEFLILTNKGGEFSPLRKTASGGEISRIMLSIKAALSGKDNIPILVFDEIDAGISGRIAGKVGKLLKELSKSHQIISITHLPQIAAKSETHLYVSKTETKGETKAEIKTLSDEEKITEVAKMLSGENVTKASIQSAKE